MKWIIANDINDMKGGQGNLGIITSLICVYVLLNLIIINREKYPDDEWIFNYCRGSEGINKYYVYSINYL